MIPTVSAVYYQPPSNLQMVFPCIVYHLDDMDVIFANDAAYKKKRRYAVTVIDTDPESTIPDAVLDLPFSRFTRTYVTDNLYHTIFRLFF